MIEPQNTTMPLPAAPAKAEASSPEGVGFGEMLAESIGMASAVDPNAVQRIVSNNQQGQQFGEDAAELPASETEPARVGDDEKSSTRTIGTPPTAEGVVRAIPTMPVALSTPTPVVDGGTVVDTKPVSSVGRDATPGRMLPTPVAPVATIETAVPVDGIGPPILTSDPSSGNPLAGQPEPAPATSTPVDSIGVPILTDEPKTPQAPISARGEGNGTVPLVAETATRSTSPVAGEPRQPVRPTDPALPPQPIPTAETQTAVDSVPSQNAPDPTRSVAPGLLRSEPTQRDPFRPDPVRPDPLRPGQDRNIPVGPTPSGAAEASSPAAHAPSPVDVAPAAASRVDLGHESPIQFSDARTIAAKVDAASKPVTVDVAASSVPASLNVAPMEAAPSQPVVTASTPDTAVQQSALAARVMRAVEMQANQPPPRTMVVDIPEIEGLRLVVSVRAGAEVHVVPTSASTTPEAFRPFMNELSSVLANRGFVMTGDGQRRGDNQR